MTDFLPDGHETLKTGKAYWKPSEMKEGENKLRILAKPIAGWIDWHENKPIRSRPDSKPTKPYNPDKPIKPFWACLAWDYAREAIFILEITQSSLLKDLTKIAKDEDWGDFTKYDIKVIKEGSGKETRYSLTPLPHKPLPTIAQNALKTAKIRLEALYEGKDPWSDHDATYGAANGQIFDSIEKPLGDLSTLIARMDEDSIPTTYLQDYLDSRASSTNRPKSEVISGALMPNVFDLFKERYMQFVAKLGTDQIPETA